MRSMPRMDVRPAALIEVVVPSAKVMLFVTSPRFASQRSVPPPPSTVMPPDPV
jgi:hypothetical protein